MPEFGFQTSGLLAEGEPRLFTQNGGGGTTTTFIDIPDEGTTWLLLGVDWYAQVSADSYFFATLTNPALAGVAWANQQELLMSLGGVGGGSWRGAMPHVHPQRMQASTVIGPHPVSGAVQMWGVVLPYMTSV